MGRCDNSQKTMKRFIILLELIALTYQVSAQSNVSYKEKDILVNGLYYNIFSDGTAEVSNKGGCYGYEDKCSGTVIIQPSITYNGIIYPVTKIGMNAFSQCKNLNRIYIPDRITHIGQGACSEGISLHKIVLPKSLQVIGGYAFCDAAIDTITIPAMVDSIGDCAFLNCHNLTVRNSIFPENVKFVGRFAFANTRISNPLYNSHIFAYLPPTFSEYSVPEGIEVIAGGAFACCSNLQKINLPMSLRYIKDHAFGVLNSYDISGCLSLSEIIIPDGVIDIDFEAFDRCTGLKKVIIGNNVRTLGVNCFASCSNLMTVALGKNLKHIGRAAFKECGNIKEITLPDGLLKIDSYCFYKCSNLIYISVPNSVIEIGENAFKDMPYILYAGTAQGAPWGAKAVCQ